VAAEAADGGGGGGGDGGADGGIKARSEAEVESLQSAVARAQRDLAETERRAREQQRRRIREHADQHWESGESGAANCTAAARGVFNDDGGDYGGSDGGGYDHGGYEGSLDGGPAGGPPARALQPAFRPDWDTSRGTRMVRSGVDTYCRDGNSCGRDGDTCRRAFLPTRVNAPKCGTASFPTARRRAPW
jgi:hypothetical protein